MRLSPEWVKKAETEDLGRTLSACVDSQGGSVPRRVWEETEDPALAYGTGDNLEALQSLLPYYAGQVKCIFPCRGDRSVS